MIKSKENYVDSSRLTLAAIFEQDKTNRLLSHISQTLIEEGVAVSAP